MKSTKIFFITFLIVLIADNRINNFKQLDSLKSNCSQTVFGEILDSESKLPIQSALVALYQNNEEISLQKVTEKGTYNFKIDCNTNYSIKVTAQNYFKEDYTFKSSSKENDLVKHPIYLNKECYRIIKGTAINQLSKEPIENVELSLNYNGDKIETVFTNSSGNYQFKLECGKNYSIVASKNNFISDFYDFTVSKSTENITHKFVLEPECIQTISGTIFNKVTKEPISAQLKLFLNNVEVETIQINNDGNYSIKFQCTTNYRIIATKTNYLDDAYNFLTDYIDNKQPQYFNLKKDLFLEPNECFQVVIGNIYDKDTHKIIANSTVSLAYQNHEIKKFQTNYDGSYFFNVKCGENYQITATKDGMKPEKIDYKTSLIKNDTKTQNIYLESENCNQTILGKILNKTNQQPIENTTVSLNENGKEISKTTTDKSGSYTFNLNCNSNYEIKITNSDFNSESVSFKTDDKREALQTKNITLTPLECNQTILGKILNKTNQQPIENTTVSLNENGKETSKTTTDKSGSYTFNLNCNSNYEIKITNSDFNSESVSFKTDDKREALQTKNITLTPLECNQTILGKILNKTNQQPIENTTVSLNENGKEISKTTTDKSGSYTFNLNCNSNYTLKTSHDNFQDNTTSFNSDKIYDKVNNITIILTPKICKQQVTGLIRDASTKKPLANTSISLYEDNTIVKTFTVGDDGVYSFDLNCNATYKLTVFKNNNLESYRIKTALENGRILNLNIDIESPECKQYINGLVKENISNTPIPNATVILSDGTNETKKVLTDSNGAFYFEIDCNKKYILTAEKLDYTKTQSEVQSNDMPATPHKVELALEPIIKFTVKNGIQYIETNPITFELDEYNLSTEAKLELNKVVFNMNQNPTIKIEVDFHTDSRGPDKYNLELTKKRAEVTKEYLVSKGINPNRITANGYGETRLLNNCGNNSKCSDAEHLVNRRTEFIVIKN